MNQKSECVVFPAHTDLRVMRRLVAQGVLTHEAVEEHLANLPDVASKGQSLAAGHAQAVALAMEAAAAAANVDDEDDEDEEDDDVTSNDSDEDGDDE